MARNASRIHLLHNCPKQYDRLLTAIDAMVFEDEPHYQQMYTILENVRSSHYVFTTSIVLTSATPLPNKTKTRSTRFT
ncbi:unnamed protein product [Toxocara canis]|uniref:IstB_IS21 domain-containing protein n=1 Tax=Toxocara canis TaxID=6265 RepID=A0A183U9X1_TOXCA|nr:unnamed protein product [Toxocara canis]